MENTVELVFIVDKSGSMDHLTEDTIGGFNGILKKHNSEENHDLVSVVLFDDAPTVLYDRVPISQVPMMTEKDYNPSGCTALLDALGSAIQHISSIHKYIRIEDIPTKTLFVVITDGFENASNEFSGSMIKKMVTEKQEKEGWEFLFIGANIDSITTGEELGFRKNRISDFIPDSEGSARVYESVGRSFSCLKRSCVINDNWDEELKEDFESRKYK